MIEQLSSVEEIHNEVKFGRCLESVTELHDERAIDLLKDVALGLSLDKKVALSDYVFA